MLAEDSDSEYDLAAATPKKTKKKSARINNDDSDDNDNDMESESDDKFECEITSRRYLTWQKEAIDEYFENEDESEESPDESSSKKKGKQKAQCNKETPILPSLPEFSPLIHTKPFRLNPCSRRDEYIETTEGKLPEGIDIFLLFFSEEMLREIVANMNYYATMKGAGETGREYQSINNRAPYLSRYLHLFWPLPRWRCRKSVD